MKFNKIAAATATAVAGLVAVPSAQAETTVTLSGQVAIGINASDAEDGIAEGDVIGIDANGNSIFAEAEDIRDSAAAEDPIIFGDDATLNINATGTLDAISPGLVGVANYRTDLGLVGDAASGDNIYVAIRGGFGEIRAGEVPDARGFGQFANDALRDIDGENAGISYTGNFGGFEVGANWSPEGSSDLFAIGAKFDFAGASVGFGIGNQGPGSRSDADSLTQFSVGAGYSIAGFSLALAYKDFDEDDNAISFTAGYSIFGGSALFTYEGNTGDVDDEAALFRLDFGYDLGNGTNISTRFNIREDNDEFNEFNDVRLLLVKAF